MVLDPNLGTTYISSIGIVHGELFADEALNNSPFNLFYSSVTACVCGGSASNSKELY